MKKAPEKYFKKFQIFFKKGLTKRKLCDIILPVARHWGKTVAAKNEINAGVAQWQSSWFVISRLLVRLRSPAPGRFPERPKGADCKSVVSDFGGPNPPSPTRKKHVQTCFFQLYSPAASDIASQWYSAYAKWYSLGVFWFCWLHFRTHR